MPIYEYQCQQCGHHVEFLQKVSDAPECTCPSCKQDSLKKLVSAAGFQLKGDGWYVTDFRDKNKPKPSSSTDTKTSPKTDSSSD